MENEKQTLQTQNKDNISIKNPELNDKNSHTMESINKFISLEENKIKTLEIYYNQVVEVYTEFTDSTQKYSNKLAELALRLKPDANSTEGQLIQALQGILLFNSDALDVLSKNVKLGLIFYKNNGESKDFDIFKELKEIYFSSVINIEHSYQKFGQEIKSYEEYLINKEVKLNELKVKEGSESSNNFLQHKYTKSEINIHKTPKKEEKNYPILIDNHEEVFNSQERYFSLINGSNNLLKKISEFSSTVKTETRKTIFSNCLKLIEELSNCVKNLNENFEVQKKVIQNLTSNLKSEKDIDLYLNPEYRSLKVIGLLTKKEKKNIEKNNNENNKKNLKKFKTQTDLRRNAYIVEEYIKKLREDNVIRIFEEMKKNKIKLKLEDEKLIKNAKIKREIEEALVLIFKEPKKYTNELKQKLIESFENSKDAQEHFFKILNDYRTEGKYNLPLEVINILGDLFKFLNDLNISKNDLDMFRYIFILSMTYFNKNENQKLYLYKFIKGNPSLKKKDFWEKYVEMLINSDITNEIYGECGNIKNNPENWNEEQKMRYNSSCFSNVLTVSRNLSDFGMDKNIINDFINNAIKKYNLTKEQIEGIKLALSITDDDDINNNENNKGNINNDNKINNLNPNFDVVPASCYDSVNKNENTIKENIKNEENIITPLNIDGNENKNKETSLLKLAEPTFSSKIEKNKSLEENNQINQDKISCNKNDNNNKEKEKNNESVLLINSNINSDLEKNKNIIINEQNDFVVIEKENIDIKNSNNTTNITKDNEKFNNEIHEEINEKEKNHKQILEDENLRK